MSAPAVTIPHDTGALSESQAIERFVAKSAAGRMPPPRSEEEIAADVEPGELDEDQAPADEDTVADDENAQVEGAEFGDEDEQTAASSDPVVKFDDGTELPMSEVKRGYLRQQDYTRKTQEAAELRKSVEGERAGFLAEKKQAAERITPLIQQAIAILENPQMQAELNELRQVDPGAYAVRMMEMQQKRASLAQLEFEQRQLRESAEREEAEKFQHTRAEAASQSRNVLMEAIPAAKKDFASWYQGLGKYVLEQGIPAESWDNEVDHRVITLAWKAMQYDRATSKTPATNAQLRKAPQPLRPGAAKPPGHAQARALREATERAYKSGTVEDMQALQMLRQRSARRP